MEGGVVVKVNVDGVGSCLHGVLRFIGFRTTKHCGCDELIAAWNRQTYWSDELIQQRVDLLEVRAKEFGYTFNRVAAVKILQACVAQRLAVTSLKNLGRKTDEPIDHANPNESAGT